MEVDWLHSVRTLIHSTLLDVDRLCNDELEECRKITDRARTREKRRQQGQDMLLSRKKELERIESLVSQVTLELKSSKQEDAKLGSRLSALQSDLAESCRKNEVTKQNIQDLTAEVVDMEHDKENKGQVLKKDFDNLMRLYKTYKKMLDMRIEWERPDIHKIWFSSSGKHSPPDMLIGTTDFSSWEVLDVRGNENLKNQLNNEFVEDRDVQKLLLKVRQLVSSI